MIIKIIKTSNRKINDYKVSINSIFRIKLSAGFHKTRLLTGSKLMVQLRNDQFLEVSTANAATHNSPSAKL